MQNFLKQFRYNLENRPEPSFQEEDWQGLQKRLDQQDKEHRSGFAWWWVALPLLFTFAGSNTLMYMKLQKAEKKIYTLENQKDTIVRTQIVFHTDTIYKTRVIREEAKYSQRLPATTGFAWQTATDSLTRHFYYGYLPSGKPIRSSVQPVPSSAQSGQANESEYLPEAGKSESSLDNQYLIRDLARLDYARPDLATFNDADLRGIPVSIPVLSKKKTLRPHLYASRPKGFRLGVAAGSVYPFRNQVEQQNGVSVGLQGIVEFSPALQLWVDAAYFKLRFETDQMDESLGVPVEPAPSDDFVFLKAEVPQTSLQYSIGMQYLFNPGKRFRPLAGAGYGVVSLMPYEVVYEFQNTALGIDWSFDKPINRREVVTGLLLLRAGFEYEFYHRWSGQVVATQRLSLGKTDFQPPPMLSIQAGLNYRF